MRRTILAAMAAAPVLAFAAAVPASARAVPTASYSHNSDNAFTITVSSNPSNYGMRAEEKCSLSGGQANFYYGPWVFSPGASSTASGSCTGIGGEITAGYFQWPKSTPHNRVTCWVTGQSRTGFC